MNKKLVKLIMKRDNLSRSEAIEAIQDCKEEIELAIAVGHYEKAEDILRESLGLEPDYLPDIIEV